MTITSASYALVVAGSGGIGGGMVRALLADSRTRKVYATYRQPDSATDLFNLASEYGNKLDLLRLDATDESQIAAVVEKIKSQTSQLHLVVNCVGILHHSQLQPEKSLRQINSENLLRYFQINSVPIILLAKHLLPLLQHNQPSILASISAKIGSIGDNYLGGWYGYRASKAAHNMLVKTTAIEYKRKSPNTIIVSLHPGTTDTNLSKPFQKNVPPEKLFSVERTVTQLLSIIENLQPGDSGQFFSWDGSRLPW